MAPASALHTAAEGDACARVGADVGGTFTDVILQTEGGGATIRKLLSTPPDYDVAVVAAVGALSEGATITDVTHGTTVATNAVLERRGALTALLTTAGFRDVLELRRLRIPRMYEPFWRKPDPLVPRRLRFEVDERIAADGSIVRPLDEPQVRRIGGELAAAGIESVAVCLLHAYANPAHERRIAELLDEVAPGLVVSVSSEILREQREYERSATTVVNAYVRPLMGRYVGAISGGLQERGLDVPLRIMQSSGGVMAARDATRRPVMALESGPAAGVVAALAIALRLGCENAIAFDMGGTTAKASLIEHGAVARGREYEVGGSLSAGSRLMRGAGELLRIPTIDISEVGAGGGSLAWLDSAAGLQVGPRSAGASPGPACYGNGGVEPTVTDANVELGLIPTGPLGDGQISVSRELAGAALATVAEPLGLTVPELAAGIHAIANAKMTRALRSVSSERGRDPREFALIAYGGSGPVHAVGLAEELGCTTVLIPALAGLFSAVGLLYARPEFHGVHTCHLDARTVALDELERRFASLREGLAGIEFVRSAELRYGGQTWEIEVPVADPVDRDALIAAFEDEHDRLYGVRGEAGAPIEIRCLRLAGLGQPRGVDRLQVSSDFAACTDVRETQVGVLPVSRRDDFDETPQPGARLIDEYDTTVVVRPGWTTRRDPATGTLILERP